MRYNAAVFAMALGAGCTMADPYYMAERPHDDGAVVRLAPDDLTMEQVDLSEQKIAEDLAPPPVDLVRSIDLIPVVGGELCQQWGPEPTVSPCQYRCRWQKRWAEPRPCNTCLQILPLLCHDGDFPSYLCVKACPVADGDICN